LINLITAWDEFFLPVIFSRSSATATLTLGITQAAVTPSIKRWRGARQT
jgi:ABC-type glycerol-3-phosphate transport system permease component